MIAKTARAFMSWAAHRTLPDSAARALKNADRTLQRTLRPVPWHDLRRLEPVAREFGYHRGLQVDRFYIERFLEENQGDIQGRVLEVANPYYTRKFGAGRVVQSDVLHVQEDAEGATIIGDLSTGQGIPTDAFDCLILTETLTSIYDIHSAAAHAVAALKPGGVLLLTVSGISQVSQFDMQRWGDYWRFTSLSLRRLLEESLPPENIAVEACGNVLVAVALLHGMVVQDLTREELEHHDPDYEISILARAVKPVSEGPAV